MRLSDVISKSSINEFTQIEGFLGNKRLKPHTQKNIAVGKVIRNFFCLECNDIRSFYSNDKLSCIIIADNLVSISCLLTCCSCGSPVPIWVLVECDNDIFSPYPQVRVLKRCEEFSNKASLNTGEYGVFSELLEKSQHAFNEKLGAGSIVYLRKTYEQITIQMAETAAIDTKKVNGKKRHSKTYSKK